ncbi:slit homolog 3 protein-like [Liolophura sinensis]|uniref:slit homolog 3 protein-like n=1 Tax=Liolophura sinensis TaxID=3198878 RepID=UPI00315983D8
MFGQVECASQTPVEELTVGCRAPPCDEAIVSCNPNPCNLGSCLRSLDTGAIECSCPPGYVGNLCQIFDPCEVNCNDRGICVADGSGYVCDCEVGFRGTNCENTTCGEGTCQNGGICHLGGCLCKLGYTGDICLTESFILSNGSFSGRSYAAFARNSIIQSDLLESIRLVVIPDTHADGLLFWLGQDSENLAMGVINRRVSLRANLGGGGLVLQALAFEVTRGQSYTILVTRQGRNLTLTMASEGIQNTYQAMLPGTDDQLNVPGNSSLYLGGVPDNMFAVTGGLYQSGFVGCISSVSMGGRLVTNIQASAKDGLGILTCPSSLT